MNFVRGEMDWRIKPSIHFFLRIPHTGSSKDEQLLFLECTPKEQILILTEDSGHCGIDEPLQTIQRASSFSALYLWSQIYIIYLRNKKDSGGLHSGK